MKDIYPRSTLEYDGYTVYGLPIAYRLRKCKNDDILLVSTCKRLHYLLRKQHKYKKIYIYIQKVEHIK